MLTSGTAAACAMEADEEEGGAALTASAHTVVTRAAATTPRTRSQATRCTRRLAACFMAGAASLRWSAIARAHCGVGDRQRAVHRHVPHVAHANQTVQLTRRNACVRPWRWPGASRGYRVGGRSRRVESDVALHFLLDLVNVAIQHGYRAKAPKIGERLCAILRPPAPFLVDGPKGHMREDHDRRATRQAFHVIFQPLQLLVPKHAQTARLEIEHIDQTHEMRPTEVEAVPTSAGTSMTEATEVLLAVIADHVMLTGHEERLVGLQLPHRLGKRVELVRLGEMREVTGMHDEVGCHGLRVDLGNGLAQRRRYIGVGCLVEADMRITQLHEAEFSGSGPCRGPRADTQCLRV